MVPTIDEVLESVIAKIKNDTKIEVKLGVPVGPDLGLYLFPYNLFESKEFHHQPPSRNQTQNAIETAEQWKFGLDCLLMSNPVENYKAVGTAMDFVTNNPVIEVKSHRVILNSTKLTSDEVAHIFISAGVPLRLTIPLNIQWTLTTE